MRRRSFLKQAGLAGAASALAPLPGRLTPASVADWDAQPTPAQQRWMELGFGLFVHFSLNTFRFRPDGTRRPPAPALYDPETIDTDGWCRAARAAGMRYVVLTAKHHDGFCNWPTALTDHSVAATPWGGDLVGELAESADKHGLAFGLYYSLSDRHHPLHDTDEAAYADFLLGQVEELLTGYGPIVELWLDGFWEKQQHGWRTADGAFTPPEAFIHAWRMEGAYRWQIDRLYRHVRALQPDCLVFNNATTRYKGVPLHPVDARAAERGTDLADDRKVWPWLGRDVYLPLQIETTLSATGTGHSAVEQGYWHHRPGDASVVPKETVLGWLAHAAALDANLLLNAGPRADGRLRPQDAHALQTLRE